MRERGGTCRQRRAIHLVPVRHNTPNSKARHRMSHRNPRVADSFKHEPIYAPARVLITVWAASSIGLGDSGTAPLVGDIRSVDDAADRPVMS